MKKKQIHLNGFIQNSPSPHSTGLWKHENDRGTGHNRLKYWIDTAKTLERGKFDAMFIADVLGTYSVYGNSHDAAARHAVQLPAHNPTLMIPAMAAATEHLGFAPTISTTYAQPYSLARQLSTLDHLTEGRIAWNVVTSYLESEAVNLGLDGRLPKALRYDRADEFLEVVYKLWEDSWEEGAVLHDREKDIFADADKVHMINHQGEFFNVPGPHLVEPSPQRTPVLFQAGASPKGRDFAAKHAEAVFTKDISLISIQEKELQIIKKCLLTGRVSRHFMLFDNHHRCIDAFCGLMSYMTKDMSNIPFKTFVAHYYPGHQIPTVLNTPFIVNVSINIAISSIDSSQPPLSHFKSIPIWAFVM